MARQIERNVSATGTSDDFRRLAESAEAPGVSKSIGQGIADARDAVARVLIRLGLTPNRATVLGFVATCSAGYCLARGATQQAPYFYTGMGPTGWWPLAAALCLLVAGAFDMLDGAIARVGNMRTRFGAVFDSTLDRFSDMAIFLGAAACFALQGNLTYQLLAVVALCNALTISYVKARAETTIADCSAGYWLRGERFAAILIGCASGHVAAVLWQLALLSGLTVLRRVVYTRGAIRAMERSKPPPPRGPAPGLIGKLQLWRHPRGSISYDVVTGLNIAYIIVIPWWFPMLLAQGRHADPIAAWLGR